ncbi:uncharacterized protein LOC122077314 isoform X1 [Macadamia integrifolia]|uniref:uncharacterized protein LOC122077314 isoform X1 n=1 Tax=Macadamia integrifolia TaxID=60698 RepID=UPI001C4E4ACA|nr:uncharacterized protein LOC122077314 isoform X1 [Macadamia integrifolia]
MSEEETRYFSKDFEWEELREEVEKDLSLRYHLLPIESSIPFSSSSSPVANQSEAWKSFHNRHSTGRFFKERRYLLKEFPELLSCHESSKVLEVGCGNGSTVLPILRGKQSIAVYACDCSKGALDRAKEMIDAADGILIKDRFHPFVCDFSLNGFPKWLVCDSCRRGSLQKYHDFPSGGNKSNEMELNELSSNRDHCCIGVLDFITLVCVLVHLDIHIGFLAIPKDANSPGRLHFCFKAWWTALIQGLCLNLNTVALSLSIEEMGSRCEEFGFMESSRSHFKPNINTFPLKHCQRDNVYLFVVGFYASLSLLGSLAWCTEKPLSHS